MRIQFKEQKKTHSRQFAFIPVSNELIDSEMHKELKQLNIRYNVLCLHAIICLLVLFVIKDMTFGAKNLCLGAGMGSVIIDLIILYKIHKKKTCIADAPTEQELKNHILRRFQKGGRACMAFSNGIAVLKDVPGENAFDKTKEDIKKILSDCPDAKILNFIIDGLESEDTRQQAFLLAELIQYFLSKGEKDILYYDTGTIPSALDKIYFP